MADRLAGKTAIVTAAAAGIGRAIARAFAAEGAGVIACDIDAGGVETLAQEHPAIRPTVLDVTDGAAVAGFKAGLGRVDVLVNAVGWVHHGTVLDCDEADWERSFALNVTSAYRLVRAVLPGMIASGAGNLIAVASIASSLKGVPFRFAYGASKAAMIGMTKALAADHVAQGIRANAICPGTVDSPSLRQRIAAQGDVETVRAAFIARQPMGRLGAPEEIADLAVYLAADESAFVTGQTFLIDGGMSI